MYYIKVFAFHCSPVKEIWCKVSVFWIRPECVPPEPVNRIVVNFFWPISNSKNHYFVSFFHKFPVYIALGYNYTIHLRQKSLGKYAYFHIIPSSFVMHLSSNIIWHEYF